MPRVEKDIAKVAGVSDTAQRAAAVKASGSAVSVRADGLASTLLSAADGRKAKGRPAAKAARSAAGGGKGRPAAAAADARDADMPASCRAPQAARAKVGVEAGRKSSARLTVTAGGSKRTVDVADRASMSAMLDDLGVPEEGKRKVLAAARRSKVKLKLAAPPAAAMAAARKAQKARRRAQEAARYTGFSGDEADAGDWAAARTRELLVGKPARKLAGKAAEKPRKAAENTVRRKLLGARKRVRSSATAQREAKAARASGKIASAARDARRRAVQARRAAAAARGGVKGIGAAAAGNPAGLALAAGTGLLLVVLSMFLMLFSGASAGQAAEDGQGALASGQAFLEACQAEVDEGEHPGGEKYWRFMGFSSRVAWCASFTSYCADKAGVGGGNPLPKSAGVAGWISGTKGTRHYARDLASGADSYVPKGGDIIIWDRGSGGGAVTTVQHIGVVEEIDDAGVIHTIEGNTSDRSMRRTHGTLADRRYDVIIEPDWPQTDAGDGSLVTDFSEDEESFVEGWGAAIDRMYAGYAGGTAPLSGYGKVMARAAYKYKIDPRLCAAISIQESSGGNYCIKAHNAWGWAAYNENTGAAASWSSWEEAIEGWHRGMSRSPALWPKTSLHELAQSYCKPPDAWEEAVGQMLGKITRQ